MTTLQKLTLRLSECREALNDLAGLDEMNDEQNAEMASLMDEMKGLEQRHRAAILANPEPEPQSRGDTLDSLVASADGGRILSAVVEHRSTTGADREIQDEFGLGGNQLPLEMLRAAHLSEHRAVTPAPTDVGRNQNAILPGVFPMGMAAWLGVDSPSVGVGQQTYTVVATNASVHEPAEGGSAAETTGSFTARTVTPSRLQAAFFWSREDAATLAGMGDALTTNLQMALADKLDERVLNAANGFLGASSPLTAVNDPSATADFAAYLAEIYNSVVLDGLYASMASQVRVLLGAETYAHAATVYRGTTADNETALEKLERVSGGVRIGAHIPAASSNDQALVVAKNPTMAGTAVAPVWQGVTLVPDEITLAATGQIRVTAVMLYGVAIMRPAAFRRREVQIA